MMKDTDLRRRKSAESRQRVLLAGISTFADKGFAGSSIRDIVGKIGCSVNAVSVHFGSKEALATAIVEELKKTIVSPVANTVDEIGSDYAWRVAVKHFVAQVVGLFNAKEAPNCYFAALYRHESANLHGKTVTLHNEIIKPLFHQLEALIALGVADRDPTIVRLWSLALWNNVIAYALKHPDVLAEDVPPGVDPQLFRATTIDFMVEKCIRELRYCPDAPVGQAS